MQDGEDRGYARLAAELGGRGVPSLEIALRELRFRPAHAAFRDLADPELFRRILAARVARPGGTPDPRLPAEVEGKARALLSAVRQHAGGKGDEGRIAGEIRGRVEALLRLPAAEGWPAGSPSPEYRSATQELLSGLERQPSRWGLLLGWLLAEGIETMRTGGEAERAGRSGIEEWGMDAILCDALRGLGREEAGADRDMAVIGFLVRHPEWWKKAKRAEEAPGRLLRCLAEEEGVRRILGFNRYQETLYLRKEALEDFLADLLAAAAVHLGAESAGTPRERKTSRGASPPATKRSGR